MRQQSVELAANCAQFLIEQAWPIDALPTHFRVPPRNQFETWREQYNRVGLIFGKGDAHQNPTLFVGFLLGKDFGAELCARTGGADIMLAIWTGPKKPSPDVLLERIASNLRLEFPDTTILTRKHMSRGWFRLTIRQPFIHGGESAGTAPTFESTYETLRAWMRAVFADPAWTKVRWKGAST